MSQKPDGLKGGDTSLSGLVRHDVRDDCEW